MPRVAYLKLAYVSVCAVWLIYLLRLLSVPCADCNPNPSAAVYCFFLVRALPSAVGYVLLFKIVPWAANVISYKSLWPFRM